MTKIDVLRRFLLPCFSPSSAAASSAIPTKKRLSTSLRDDLPDPPITFQDQEDSQRQLPAPPRPSKTMVVGTIFGTRPPRGATAIGHVSFCVQPDRLSTKPMLLLELSIPTHQLVKELRFGSVRIALESDRPEFRSVSLRSVPVWTMFLNGKKLGFAVSKKANERTRLMLKSLQNVSAGAGVIPSTRFGSGQDEDDNDQIMYMRANYEHVVGSADVEYFHLINPEHGVPDGCCGQELSVFLMRSSG